YSADIEGRIRRRKTHHHVAQVALFFVDLSHSVARGDLSNGDIRFTVTADIDLGRRTGIYAAIAEIVLYDDGGGIADGLYVDVTQSLIHGEAAAERARQLDEDVRAQRAHRIVALSLNQVVPILFFEDEF